MDLAQALRQVICDKHSLAAAVNWKKLKLTFRPNKSPPDPNPHLRKHLVFSMIEDGLDPDTSPFPDPDELNLGQFLRVVVLTWRGDDLTVKDVINYARSVAGGTHYDPTDQFGPWAALQSARTFIEVNGAPAGISQLRSIARVTLKALAPLIEDVKMRVGNRASPALLGKPPQPSPPEAGAD